MRKLYGIEQVQMVDYVGIKRATWSDYENGKTEPKLESLINISDFFGIGIDLLLRHDISTDAPLIKEIEERKKRKDANPNAPPSAPLTKDFYKMEPDQMDLILLNEPDENISMWLAEVKRTIGEMKQEMDEIKKNLNK